MVVSGCKTNLCISPCVGGLGGWGFADDMVVWDMNILMCFYV